MNTRRDGNDIPRDAEPDTEHRRDGVETAERSIPRPFDTRELERLRWPTEDDPPYRSWWVE